MWSRVPNHMELSGDPLRWAMGINSMAQMNGITLIREKIYSSGNAENLTSLSVLTASAVSARKIFHFAGEQRSLGIPLMPHHVAVA